MNDDAKPTKTSPEKSSPDWPMPSVELTDPKTAHNWRGVAILFAVLIIWCLLIAIGSFQTQASTDYRRPLIVVLTMGSFLGIWAIALRQRVAKQPTRR